MDTIFALATARGRAGVAVIRISGPLAWEAVRRLAGDVPLPRRASLRRLSWSGEQLDEGLIVTFPAGASFTGEQSAELHLHGSVATVAAVSRTLGGFPGLRPAEAGEFTRRALENGRLDLTQVEGLADLIDAETEAQRRQALRVLEGDIGRRAAAWRQALVRASALVEAGIDFADEDIGETMPEVRRLIAPVLEELRSEERGFGASERVRDGFEVAIVGPPNAGKSTLLNRIAGREAALTSAEPGTTRDVIEVRLDLGGLAVTLLDTAGIRESAAGVEAAGIARARDRAAAADLRVFLGEVAAPGRGSLTPGPDDLVVAGKADLNPAERGLAVSGLTGQGVEALLDSIRQRLERRVASPATITRERHRRAVASARQELEGCLAPGPAPAEIISEHLRTAVRALDSLIGRVDVEDLLDEIFARFCIGK